MKGICHTLRYAKLLLDIVFLDFTYCYFVCEHLSESVQHMCVVPMKVIGRHQDPWD